MKESKFDLSDKGLFGTSLLPKRSLKRRYLAAKAGRTVFVAIAVTCGIILVTLLTQISSEAFVPTEEFEVERSETYTEKGTNSGVYYHKPAETQLSWEAETWNPNWAEDDLRQERENITIRASWTERHFQALNDDGDAFNLNGQTTWDLAEDLERALCDEGVARTTYRPVEPWSLSHLLLIGSADEYEYKLGEDWRITIYWRETAPTPNLGNYWIQIDDNDTSDVSDDEIIERYIWRGLRWEIVGEDAYLDEAMELAGNDQSTWGDGKIRLIYRQVPWTGWQNGDLLFYNTGQGTDVVAVSQKGVGDIPLDSINEILLKPAANIKSFVPEFCTMEETSKYILDEGLTGSYVIGEVTNEDGYVIEELDDSGLNVITELEIAISETGDGHDEWVMIDDRGFINYDHDNDGYGNMFWDSDSDGDGVCDYYPEEIPGGPFKCSKAAGPLSEDINGDGRIDINDYGENPIDYGRTVVEDSDSILHTKTTNTLVLSPSRSSDNWLFILHDLNYTVTIQQTSGPPMDAKESSYQEIGGFALGSPVDWFQPKFIGDDDFDNDGIIDVCDEDIDQDSDKNPIYGDPNQCPEDYEWISQKDSTLDSLSNQLTEIADDDEQERARVEALMDDINASDFALFVHLNDENGDGVHDDTKDRDIDSDGVPNLIDGQGTWAGRSMESKFAEDEQEAIDEYVELLVVNKCSDTYKKSSLEYATKDCNNAKELNATKPTTPQSFCDGIRTLNQQDWLQSCAAPINFESGADVLDHRDPWLPLFAMFGLVGMIFVMRTPEKAIRKLRDGMIRIGTNEVKSERYTKYSWFSYSSELANRLISAIVKLIITVIGALIFFSTFSESQPELLVPFTFIIGGAITLMASIALVSSATDIVKLRPEKLIPKAEGVVDFVLLALTFLTWYIAITWILVQGWIVGGLLLLFMLSGIKKLVLGALQLTRSNTFKDDRLRLVVKGRDGWLMAAFVALAIAMVSIPVGIHIPFIWSDFTSSEPYKAGLRAAFWGSVYVVSYTMLFAIPLSLGAAIWLEEYAPNNRFRRAIQALITNLAGVPAIVFGLFGLALFLTDRGIGLGLGGTVLTAGMTMATMAMPTIVISSQEALRAVPPSLRNAAFGLGCTKWQVTKDHVLPHAMPGMMTGTILAMSRIMGEAAPLILVGAVASVFTEPDAFFYISYDFAPNFDYLFAWIPGVEPYMQNLPVWSDRELFSADPSAYTGADTNDRGAYTVLPVQVYRWTDMPATGFKVAAAGASIVLLGTLLVVNSAAILLRAHFRRYSNT